MSYMARKGRPIRNEQSRVKLENSEWLEYQYVQLQRGSTSIAKELDVSPSTVIRYLRKHSIPLRSAAESAEVSAKRRRGDDVNSKLNDSEWLNYHYWILGKSIKTICEELGISHKVFPDILRSHGIEIRDHALSEIIVKSGVEVARKLADPDWLHHKYIEDGWSSNDIADHLGISNPRTVLNRLRFYGIPVRDYGECFHMAMGNHIDLNSELIDLIEGTLLGDANIYSASNFSAYYRHSKIYLDYINWLNSKMLELGVDGSTWTRNKEPNDEHTYASLSYAEFKDIYDRWYPDGFKVVPPDFKITPVKAIHMLIDDGTIDRRSWAVSIATFGFTREGVQVIADELGRYGISAWPRKATAKKTSKYSHHWELYLSRKTTDQFYEWIGPPPVGLECFNYKWPPEFHR